MGAFGLGTGSKPGLVNGVEALAIARSGATERTGEGTDRRSGAGTGISIESVRRIALGCTTGGGASFAGLVITLVGLVIDAIDGELCCRDGRTTTVGKAPLLGTGCGNGTCGAVCGAVASLTTGMGRGVEAWVSTPEDAEGLGKVGCKTLTGAISGNAGRFATTDVCGTGKDAAEMPPADSFSGVGAEDCKDEDTGCSALAGRSLPKLCPNGIVFVAVAAIDCLRARTGFWLRAVALLPAVALSALPDDRNAVADTRVGLPDADELDHGIGDPAGGDATALVPAKSSVPLVLSKSLPKAGICWSDCFALTSN